MTTGQRIEDLFARYSAAVAAKDADAFLAIFDEKVRVFDTWGRWLYEGAGEWRAMAQGWFGGLGDETVTAEFSDVHVTSGETVAGAHAFVMFTGYSAAGERLRSMTNRLSWVLARDPAGEWKVVHEHTSAPAELETGKVILRR
jgi:uncharacterized protein (TIGR02246 family)